MTEAAAAGPARPTAGGLLIDLRVQPGASKSALAGVEADAAGAPRLKLRIASPPVDGAANAAVVAFLAKALKTPKRTVALTHGLKNRSKTVRIEGDAADLMARLDRLLGEGP